VRSAMISAHACIGSRSILSSAVPQPGRSALGVQLSCCGACLARVKGRVRPPGPTRSSGLHYDVARNRDRISTYLEPSTGTAFAEGTCVPAKPPQF
jgi:hypothetical protein